MINRTTFKIVYIIVNAILFIYNANNPIIADIIFIRVTSTGRSFIESPLVHFIPMDEKNILKIMLSVSKIELKYIPIYNTVIFL